MEDSYSSERYYKVCKMIKQSFLRNYSLSKIYSEAEDQKKKLKVFYIRQVRKIMKQQSKMKHEQQKMTKITQNKEMRAIQRAATSFQTPNHIKQQAQYSSTSHSFYKQRPKLIISQLKLLSPLPDLSLGQQKNMKARLIHQKSFHFKRSLDLRKTEKNTCQFSGTSADKTFMYSSASVDQIIRNSDISVFGSQKQREIFQKIKNPTEQKQIGPWQDSETFISSQNSQNNDIRKGKGRLRILQNSIIANIHKAYAN